MVGSLFWKSECKWLYERYLSSDEKLVEKCVAGPEHLRKDF